MKQEKTYIIENKDINIFNIDINKNNNSLICYNIDKINTDECKNNKNGNNIIADNNNLIMNNSFNKYKKQFEVIRNFKNYKRKKECGIEDKIKIAMEKCKPEDKIIKFEGKIAINNITYDKEKEKNKPYTPPNYQEIKSLFL